MNNFQEVSFKDPFGRISNNILTENLVNRTVFGFNIPLVEDFFQSNLYKLLVEKKWILPVSNIKKSEKSLTFDSPKIPFIIYPNEWTFNQWKDAALLTLKIQKKALIEGYSLKDATPFNIVFEGSQPRFVDYFSLEKYIDNQPWVAFEQFVKMFYLPLLLKSYTKIDFSKFILSNIDGLSPEDYSKLLPYRVWFNFKHFVNIILPYRLLSQNKRKDFSQKKSISKANQIKMIEFLYNSILSIDYKKKLTTWNDYYSFTILENEYLETKEEIVETLINDYLGDTNKAIDFGANNGYFTKKLADKFDQVLGVDIDFDAIDEFYLENKSFKSTNIYSLQTELHNPAPAFGFNHLERFSFSDRVKSNLGLVLAITHHLRITNNVPFELQAKFFANICEYLVIEFVGKQDPKVEILLAQKEDVYPDYTIENFIQGFSHFYEIQEQKQVEGFERVLFKMKRK